MTCSQLLCPGYWCLYSLLHQLFCFQWWSTSNQRSALPKNLWCTEPEVLSSTLLSSTCILSVLIHLFLFTYTVVTIFVETPHLAFTHIITSEHKWGINKSDMDIRLIPFLTHKHTHVECLCVLCGAAMGEGKRDNPVSLRLVVRFLVSPVHM